MTVFFACTPYKRCSSHGSYVSKIDTTKPYMLKGIYCIESTKDTVINGDMGIVSFHVFDRRNGDIVREGVTWFTATDTSKVLFNEGSAFKQLPEGDYVLTVSNSNYLALKTRTIRIERNRKISINFYLGNSLQW